MSSAVVQTVPIERLLTIEDVMALTGLKKTTIYALHADGKMPRALPFSRRRLRWTRDSIQAWVAGLPSQEGQR